VLFRGVEDERAGAERRDGRADWRLLGAADRDHADERQRDDTCEYADSHASLRAITP
jgi:hypothetical protein